MTKRLAKKILQHRVYRRGVLFITPARWNAARRRWERHRLRGHAHRPPPIGALSTQSELAQHLFANIRENTP